MTCSKCNKNSTLCGCTDTYLSTNPNSLDSTLCPEPIPCSEYVNAACVYLNDGIFDGAIDPGTSLEEIIQQLILMITNPECTQTDSCNCPGGGGTIYNGDQGIYKDTSVTPETFVLGAPTGQESTIAFKQNRFIDTDDYYLQLKGNGGVIVAREGNEALPPKLSTINATADQNAYAGYFLAKSFPAIYAQTGGVGQTALEVINDGTGATSTSATFACDEGKGILSISKFTNTLSLNVDGSSPTAIDEALILGKTTTSLVTPAVGQGISIGMGPGRDVFGYLIPRGTVLNSVMSYIGDDGRVPVQAVVDFRVDTYNYGSVEPHMTCVGYGLLKLHKYGIGTFADTPAYLLGVTATGDVIETEVPTPVDVTASNGVYEETPNDFQLGSSTPGLSTFTAARYISAGNFNLNLSGTLAGPTTGTLVVTNNTGTANPGGVGIRSVASGTNSIGILAQANASTSVGVFASGSQFGMQSQSSTGSGIQSETSSTNGFGVNAITNVAGYALQGARINGPTNTVEKVLNVLKRGTGNIGATGIGASIDYSLSTTTSGNERVSNRLISSFKDAALGTCASTFTLTGINATGNGQNTLIEIDSDVSAGTLFRIMNALPTSPAGLAAGSLYTQTATEIGGSGTTKVICIV